VVSCEVGDNCTLAVHSEASQLSIRSTTSSIANMALNKKGRIRPEMRMRAMKTRSRRRKGRRLHERDPKRKRKQQEAPRESEASPPYGKNVNAWLMYGSHLENLIPAATSPLPTYLINLSLDVLRKSSNTVHPAFGLPLPTLLSPQTLLDIGVGLAFTRGLYGFTYPSADLSILKGYLGFGGPLLVKKKDQLIDLVLLLIDKTKSERGYSNTAQLITRILHTLVGVYPLNSRFVNDKEWTSAVPSGEEIQFVLDFLDRVASPTLSKIEQLLQDTSFWDNASRNDFCRYLQACRAIWAGLPTFIKEEPKNVANHRMYGRRISRTRCATPRRRGWFHASGSSRRLLSESSRSPVRFGEVVPEVCGEASPKDCGEDRVDTVMAVSRAINVYLLDHGLTKGRLDAFQKSYSATRDMNRMRSRQVENCRLVFVKRAQLYHSSRVYMHSLYRRRNALDDALITQLVELSLSPYTRVRRHVQPVLQIVFGSYVRSTRFPLPTFLQALTKGNDPDRMKGALYVLSNKGIASYAITDLGFHRRLLISLLGCQHEEKPSIQKLVGVMAHECNVHLGASHTDAYALRTPAVDQALDELRQEFSPSAVNTDLLKDAASKTPVALTKLMMFVKYRTYSKDSWIVEEETFPFYRSDDMEEERRRRQAADLSTFVESVTEINPSLFTERLPVISHTEREVIARVLDPPDATEE
ncbi:Proteasome activator BLM10, partial [Marasmius crinis-equi]